RLEDIIAELNPILRGWFGYFKHARHTTFRDLDSFVRRRLRAMLRKREKRPGFGLTHADHRRWPNAFFAQRGLCTLHEAYVVARQPQGENPGRKSRVGENRLHGSEGGEGFGLSRPLSTTIRLPNPRAKYCPPPQPNPPPQRSGSLPKFSEL